MSDSLTRSAIKLVSKEHLEPLLMPRGFVRRAPHFFMQSKDVYHCIHFQASQWGSAASGRFTINLSVTASSLYEHWKGRSLPANPATALWPIQQRIGLLSRDRLDHWWDVTEHTDVKVLGQEVVSLVGELALPFLAAYQDTDAILAVIRSTGAIPGVVKSQTALIEAMLLADRGQSLEARDCLLRALTQNRLPGFRPAILTIGRRLGMDLERTTEKAYS